MNCPCGSQTAFFSHSVKRIEKAREWSARVEDGHLPVRIDRDCCPQCGRERAQIFSHNGKLIEVRG